MTSHSADILNGLRQAIGPPGSGIPLHEPEFTELENAYVMDCLKSTFVSSVGEYVDRLEAKLSAFTGARHVVVVTNGTAALQVALSLAGVKPDDEVLVPAMSFVATANAVSHCHAVPHFVDVDESTFGIDASSLRAHLQQRAALSAKGLVNVETGRTIKALVPMHAFGHPADMDALLEIADEFDLQIVEDAAESLGSIYKDKHTGTLGKLGTLSFNGNKIVTTGGGGAILTDDDELARMAKHLTTTAKVPHSWQFKHDMVAWNYRMPNINAALGCAQMDQIQSKLERKRSLAARYSDVFSNISGCSFMAEPASTVSNYWLCSIRLEESDQDVLGSILSDLHQERYFCRPAWDLLCDLPPYIACPKANLPVARKLVNSIICLPSSPQLLENLI